MKGDLNRVWKALAFSLLSHWMTPGLAEAPSSENPAKLDETTTGLPRTEVSDWKLSKFFDGWKLPETVQIHGFASQSYLRSTGNEFFGHTTNMGSLDFTEMGINGSWRPISQLQASMQVVYRRAGKTDNSGVRIDFGFLDYSFISDAGKVLGVRMGRVVNPYGLYNDTRDMPFTRPSMLLPQSIYFDNNRNLALSGDGIQLYGEYHNNLGDFLLQTNGFYSRADDPSFNANFGDGDFSGQPSWATRLMYERGGGQVRLGVTGVGLNVKDKPHGTNTDPLYINVSPIVFSAQYNAEKWSLTSEYAIRNVELTGGGFPGMISRQGESYYFQGSYRFTPNVEGFVRYDVQYEDTTDRSGQKYHARTGFPADNQFAKDIAGGLRWDISDWFMVRAEYHHINGTGWIPYLENKGTTQKYWNLFGVSVNFRF